VMVCSVKYNGNGSSRLGFQDCFRGGGGVGFRGFGAVAGLCRRFSQKNAIFEPVGERVQGLSLVRRVF